MKTAFKVKYFFILFKGFSVAKMSTFNPIQDRPFWGCSQMGDGSQKGHPHKNLSHISYNDETWHNYTLPKEDSKNI